MGIRTKYSLTAIVILSVLIGLVAVARSQQTRTLSESPQARQSGPSDAPVRLVVYSDFQCPACRNARELIEKLKNQFGDAVQIQFRHYPIERNHRWALAAAQFAECAAEQNQFWAYHDRLYDEQPNWSKEDNAPALFAQYARELGLDFEALRACVMSPEAVSRIRRERSEGAAEGVRSTPTFFINDRVFVGTHEFAEKAEQTIREALTD